MTITRMLETEDRTLHLPRMLCLHGGGSNARIFRTQYRVIRAELRDIFRLCIAEAPFYSQPGPDVVSFYKEYCPFRRWLRSGPEHRKIDPRTATHMIDECLHAAMKEDDNKGAMGEWVGLLGLSRGYKMCASLLFRQQKRTEKLGSIGQAQTFALRC